jgi:hypothetical protein
MAIWSGPFLDISEIGLTLCPFPYRKFFITISDISRLSLSPYFYPTPNSWTPFSWLLHPTFYTALWTVKVNFLVKKLGAVALNYLYMQEIDPRSTKLSCKMLARFWLKCFTWGLSFTGIPGCVPMQAQFSLVSHSACFTRKVIFYLLKKYLVVAYVSATTWNFITSPVCKCYLWWYPICYGGCLFIG